MKILPAGLATMMSLPTSEAQKLGSEADPIRQGLFASEPMNVFAQRLKLDGNPGLFYTFVEAVELANSGKKEEAKAHLRSILDLPNLETRIMLLVWSALRELGEDLDAKSAKEVLGVVVEVPMRGAYDTLAAYQDGSARYLNFSGAAIFWDARDEAVTTLCRGFIASSVSVGAQAKPRRGLSLPKQGAQLTLLTRSGPYIVTEIPPTVMKPASALMVELMHRAKQAKK
jgi:hypothetical protein